MAQEREAGGRVVNQTRVAVDFSFTVAEAEALQEVLEAYVTCLTEQLHSKATDDGEYPRWVLLEHLIVSQLLYDLDTACAEAKLEDSSTVSFTHLVRQGDQDILCPVLEELSEDLREFKSPLDLPDTLVNTDDQNNVSKTVDRLAYIASKRDD